jgi:hypothetical protein
MKRPIVLISCVFAIAAFSIPSGAEDKPGEKALEIGRWYPSLESGVTLTQGSYSSNWAGGDRGSLVWTLITNFGLQRQVDPRLNWTNDLKLAYGQTHQQKVDNAGNRFWDSPEKSTDLIDYETVARFTLGGYVDPFVSGRFESQFQDQSDPLGRGLSFNPLKYSESAGVARKLVNRENRSVLSRVGFTFRQSSRRTFTDVVNPSVKTTRSAGTNDGGFEWVTDAKTGKKISWTSKLIVYQPVFYSGKKDLKNAINAGLASGVDVDAAGFTTLLSADWENVFSTQITKVVSLNLYTRWLFDKYDNTVKPVLDSNGGLTNVADVQKAIRKAGQFKETLSVGITYRFL